MYVKVSTLSDFWEILNFNNANWHLQARTDCFSYLKFYCIGNDFVDFNFTLYYRNISQNLCGNLPLVHFIICHFVMLEPNSPLVIFLFYQTHFCCFTRLFIFITHRSMMIEYIKKIWQQLLVREGFDLLRDN